MNRLCRLLIAMVLFLAAAPPARAQLICEDPPRPEICSLDDGLILVEWRPHPFSANEVLQWQLEHGFTDFNVYRGRLKSLADADHNGALDSYGTCLVEQTPEFYTEEPDVPPLGDAYIYSVTGQTYATEADLGVASNGMGRPNAFPCSNQPGHPVIESFGPVTRPGNGHAACDLTLAFKGWLCSVGFPANQFVSFPTLTMGVDFTEILLQARVTDPENTPAQSDITQVTTTFLATYIPYPSFTSQDLLDDAGLNATPVGQQNNEFMEGCSADPVCPQCTAAAFPTTSHDAAVDDTFTTDLAFVRQPVVLDAPAGISHRSDLALDCIAAGRGLKARYTDVPSGQGLDFSLKVRDRAGHATQIAPVAGGTPGPSHFACAGDECACCLLLSVDRVGECADRPGLVGVPGSGFEHGLCVDLF